jgi:hypothetical protein
VNISPVGAVSGATENATSWLLDGIVLPLASSAVTDQT